MTQLPITHLTLYKHGVAFYERRATVRGAELHLSFRAGEMNDILKSLTVIDWGGGQVLGVEYATPQSREERLVGCSVRLDDARSLRDLLIALRGRSVKLLLDQGEEVAGTLVGLDEVPERQPLATSLVSLLHAEVPEVRTVALGRVLGVDIQDERGARDLRFFLETSMTEDETRQVTIRLTPGEHDLSVSYIAPAPTWRVGYRLVADRAEKEGSKALLQAWGVFDNRLEEDLEGISLALVAGMPISFVYDLYRPHTPERPVVEEEDRVAASPVAIAPAYEAKAVREARDRGAGAMFSKMMVESMADEAQARQWAISGEALEAASLVSTAGEDLGELFQYIVSTPVSVSRGQSAMVPIVSSQLTYRKDLLYNGAEYPTHPVATLRLANETGLTLERGPVTVLESGTYVGEAVLPLTTAGGEVVVPYAIELGIKVQEHHSRRREIRGLKIEGVYLQIEEWDIRRRDYQLTNNTGEGASVLVEHPRTADYELFDMDEPAESTDRHLRFEVAVPARSGSTLRVRERRLLSRREELQKQSYRGLQHYLRQGLIDRAAYDQVAGLLSLWEKIADREERLDRVDKDRDKIYKSQNQIQGHLGTLSKTGKEGELRARYVEQLGASELQLNNMAKLESDLREEIEGLREEINRRLEPSPQTK